VKAQKNNFFKSILLFLAVMGPGLITGSVDNDAGGITTYSVLGANYGFRLLWILIPSFIVLVVVQEMNARMGIVTGKGLADLIRENFGLRITLFIFLGLLLADIGNTATEFAGIAGSMSIFGISKYISVPIGALFVWILVVKGTYKSTEKIFLIFSAFLLSYVVSAILAKPDWSEVAKGMITPSMKFDEPTLLLVVATIGTTIAPWMQFYMQSAVIEKKISIDEFKYEQWDVVIGSIATIVVAFFIVVACGATLYPNGVHIEEAKDAAVALKPFAGALASDVFAFGLFIASVFSATILPIATAFYVCEAFGFEAGVNKRWNEAPAFYSIFTGILVIAVVIILIPNAPLIKITIGTQMINGVLLPVVLYSMIRLVNDKEIMGQYTNKLFNNIVGYGTVCILVILSLLLLIFNFI
jgi:NRAMP (natural resistance-associated macrophage protein)-like metal ion transporter